MAAPDLDIHRTAYLFVRFHGDAAAERARMIAERMHSKGDHEGADTWLRIIVAIGELGEPKYPLSPEIEALRAPRRSSRATPIERRDRPKR